MITDTGGIYGRKTEKSVQYWLETVTDFNIEARYPDEKFSFKKKCTRDFAERYLIKIKEMKEWLLRQIQS
ncbi:MAG: HEPN domain-containing protein [Planctomycetia bacterium]|nr:HEPN domain-containing protein [Planctomycetia bacterium]